MPQEQLRQHLDQLVASHKVVQQGGLYMSAKSAPASPETGASLNGATAASQTAQQQGPVRSAPTPQPQRGAVGGGGVAVKAGSATVPQGLAQYEPAIMSLLGNYSGLALDRMHGMLQKDPRAKWVRQHGPLSGHSCIVHGGASRMH